MLMDEDVNVCCPFFDIAECEDTEEHCHLYCQTNGDLMKSSRIHEFCVSDDNWENCPYYKAYPIQIPFTD
jgi:hypothetical protein